MPIPQLKVKKPQTTENIKRNTKKGKKTKGKKKITKKDILRKKPSKKEKWFKVLKILIIIGVICFLIGIIVVAGIFAWFSKELPDPDKISERSIVQSTRIYDRTGEILLYEIHGDTNRTLIKLEEIPDYCKNATIAIEDSNFYKHPGFDLKGIIRAGLAHIFGWDVKGGGSTITQQFIKNSILTSERTLTRKIKEVVLAYQMERKFSKDQILQLYLNEIPYGSTAYGIESAANNYFGKSAKDLNLTECATLAALPQSPSYYMNNVNILIGRQEYIISRMHDLGYITEEEKDAGIEYQIEFKKRIEKIIAPHFVFYVKEFLSKKYGEKKVEQGGLKVITTLDMFKQEKAQETIDEYAENNLNKYNASNAAMVSIDTKTGQILSMIGSKDYFNESIDGQVNVATRNRQPGSSFKPFVYLTAFSMGYTPQTILFDIETDFGGTPNYHPHNYDWGQRGPTSMQMALAGSLNIPAVKTLYLVGVDNAVNTAEKFGYTTFTNKENYGLALVLGGAEVTLLEHTSAFATLSREGERHSPTPILKIGDSSGRVLEEYKEKKEQVFDAEAVRKINYILSTDRLRSYVFGSNSNLTLSDRPVATKTGTTNDFRDGWTMGYTPSIATGVWVGNNNNTEMNQGAAGFNVASPIWNSYMKKILEGTPVENFQDMPKSEANKPILYGEINKLAIKKVDKDTNEIIPDECLSSYPAEYIIDKEFKETHNILYYIIKNDPLGPYPNNPGDDPQFNNWEGAVIRWAEGQEGYLTDKTPKADCDQRSEGSKPTIEIISPSDGGTYDNGNFSISVKAKAANNRMIKKIEYMIDLTIVDTQTVGPFFTTYKPNNLTDGKHTLKVIAYDDKNNSKEDQVNFSFNNTAIGSHSFSKPASNSSFKKNQLPFEVGFTIEKTNNISSLEFYYYNTENSSNQSVLYTARSLSKNNFNFLSPTNIEKGNYVIYAKITTMNGSVTTSRLLPFSITD